MTNQSNIEACQCVTESIIDAITDITKILQATRVGTLQSTVENMTVTIPSMVSIPAETNLKALQNTIKNMANTTKVEAIQHTIKIMASTTTDINKLLPETKVNELQKVMENTSENTLKITKIFSELDWDNFEPTDKDVKKAREILGSKDIEYTIAEGIKNKKIGDELPASLKTVLLDLMLLYHTMMFISDAAALTIIESNTEE